MLEINSTKQEVIQDIVFSLVKAGYIPCDDNFNDVDKAIGIVDNVLQDVTSIVFNKKIVVNN